MEGDRGGTEGGVVRWSGVGLVNRKGLWIVYLLRSIPLNSCTYLRPSSRRKE